jgi:hypothetical protein
MSIEEYHGDIERIIQNSLLFNRNNIEIYDLTLQF